MFFSVVFLPLLAVFLDNDCLFHLHNVTFAVGLSSASDDVLIQLLDFHQRPLTYYYMKTRLNMLHAWLTFLILWLLFVIMIKPNALSVRTKSLEHFYSRRIGS